MTNAELQFLPAALEIEETPPSPIGRAIMWVLVALFTTAILWAIVGHIDIVAVAQGKIIASGRDKVIQPFEIGVVRAIHVTEGQVVNAGDLLIELDPTQSQADEARLGQELDTERLKLLRLETQAKAIGAVEGAPASMDLDAVMPEWPASSAKEGNSPRAEPAAALALQQRLLDAQLNEYHARRAVLENTLAQRQAERQGTAEEIKKLEATVPLITKRANSLKTLSDKSLVATNTYLELEQQRIEQSQNLAVARNRSLQAKAAIEETQKQLEATREEFLRNTLAEQAEVENKIASLAQELIKASQRASLQKLTAPIAGQVQQLAVHTVGGVVTPAQPLMVIVPQEHPLEIEAWVPNKDIGFVNEGQQAEIKVETFPFTKYGTLDAELLHVSHDAVENEKLGLVYAARVAMHDAHMQVEDKLVNLSPGMAVTVEIKTGHRRLIEYFLSPLLRYQSESVRER